MQKPLAVLLFIFFSIPLITSDTISQNHGEISPQILESTWDARWIMHPTGSNTDYGVFHFRHTFELDEEPDSFIIHVSGDTRYRLFINGRPVAKGPAVGDNHNWRFETVDIAGYLQQGTNVAAATVWNFSEYNALQHHSYRTAFIMQGNTETEAVINTGPGWSVTQNKGYSPIPVSYQTVDGYYASPHGEHLITEAYPWGWMEAGYDVSGWDTVRLYEPGTPRGTNPYGNLYGWNLIPRNIPLMEERNERIPVLRRAEGIGMNDGFLRGTSPLRIPANSRTVLLLDQTYIINAYPVLHISGGRNSEIKLIYAESLRYPDNTKGNRNEIDGKQILGFHDIFIPDGGENRTLQTLWLRSYRYIQLEIETKDDPLLLHDMYGIFTGYPFEENAQFHTDDETLTDIWEAGWRTARLNAFESYWDCAYYEQLQYVGDTRVQALISLYVSGDDRLMRNSILHFNDSRMPDGITMSRYPSRHPQYIPPYALLWIPMIHDYWMHRKDDDFVRQFFPGIRSVISWYEGHLDKELGILGPMPWWNYVDAARGFARGTPPGSDDGNSIVITLQMLYVLEYALELAEVYGETHDAARYLELIDTLRKSIPKHGWNEERQLMADTPQHDRYSQHANILAVLTGLIPEDEQASLMHRILEEQDLVQVTYYFRFYLTRAMNKAGLANEYLEHLGPWYDALALGMTTFPEHPEPSRSDAHAWSASPNYDFLATVAGIRPGSPGFETVLIEPKPGHLENIEAKMPHPLGNIEVSYIINTNKIEAEITLPEGLSGSFVWMGQRVELSEGTQRVVM
ncbi:MAG: alpha-L-rhamnosidase [Balneolaceae bacterium]|nr:MAG: alpha-L-rhamnosidase [Balneolaceae bacterium]